MSEKRDYSDIMHCSRPELHRPRMPMSERAAQFAPFSALSGYQELIAESGRHVEPRHELIDDQNDQLDQALNALRRFPQREVRVTCYDDDGMRRHMQGKVKDVRPQEGTLILMDGTVLSCGDIVELEIL